MPFPLLLAHPHVQKKMNSHASNNLTYFERLRMRKTAKKVCLSHSPPNLPSLLFWKVFGSNALNDSNISDSFQKSKIESNAIERQTLIHLILSIEQIKHRGVLTCQGLVHFAGFGHLDRQGLGTEEKKRDDFKSKDQTQTKQRQFNNALLPPECQGPGYTNRDLFSDEPHLGPSPTGSAAVFKELCPYQSFLLDLLTCKGWP